MIVRVDHGPPFDQNPCLGTEIASADHYALYINTGYDPTYTNHEHTIPAGRSEADETEGTARQRAAWAVGCSEARRSMRYVELANSWSDTDLALNQHTLDGIVDTLDARSGAPVGVYSSAHDWQAIVGEHHVKGLDVEWVATGVRDREQAKRSCDASFTGAGVLLVQSLGTFDTDYVCR